MTNVLGIAINDTFDVLTIGMQKDLYPYINSQNLIDDHNDHNDHNDQHKPMISFLPLESNKIFPQNFLRMKRMDSTTEDFEVSWRNLSLAIEKYSIFSCNESDDYNNVHTILNDNSGHFKSGELTAIMGPSGAGKSSLLRCISGIQSKGTVTGEIKVIGSNYVKVSFISQYDYLMERFTVRESLLFASKVKIGTKQFNHTLNILKVAKILNLVNCLDTYIGKCSGGQKKRISIALELVSKPNILILDEPTTGLDSSSCFYTVKTLKELTKQKKPMAIVATIHQPSGRVFSLFDKVYVISYDGQCIYHGTPEDLPNHIASIGIEFPEFSNPADNIIEIASGEYGKEPIDALISDHKRSIVEDLNYSERDNLSDHIKNPNHPFFHHLYLLFIRSFKIVIREPFLCYIRIFASISIAILLYNIFGDKIGTYSGCPPTQLQLYESEIGQLFKHFEDDALGLRDNFGAIFISVLITMILCSMPIASVFPNEYNAVAKQYHNGWYGITTYYIAMVMADIPLEIISGSLYVSIIYVMTGQSRELFRYVFVLIGSLGVFNVAQSHGIIFSIIFNDSVVIASFMTVITSFPAILMSGLFVRVSKMPWYLAIISYLSYPRYGFESWLIALYGFDRCPFVPKNSSIPDPKWFSLIRIIDSHDNKEYDYSYHDDYQYDGSGSGSGSGSDDGKDAVDKILDLISGPFIDPNNRNRHQSFAMSQFQLTNEMLYFDYYCLGIYILLSKIAGFVLLYWKLNQKHH